MAKAIGAKVVGTSGSAEKLRKLKALGLDVGIETRKGDFCDAVMKATDGHGADLALNNVGNCPVGNPIGEGALATVQYLPYTSFISSATTNSALNRGLAPVSAVNATSTAARSIVTCVP